MRPETINAYVGVATLVVTLAVLLVSTGMWAGKKDAQSSIKVRRSDPPGSGDLAKVRRDLDVAMNEAAKALATAEMVLATNKAEHAEFRQAISDLRSFMSAVTSRIDRIFEARMDT